MSLISFCIPYIATPDSHPTVVRPPELILPKDRPIPTVESHHAVLGEGGHPHGPDRVEDHDQNQDLRDAPDQDQGHPNNAAGDHHPDHVADHPQDQDPLTGGHLPDCDHLEGGHPQNQDHVHHRDHVHRPDRDLGVDLLLPDSDLLQNLTPVVVTIETEIMRATAETGATDLPHLEERGDDLAQDPDQGRRQAGSFRSGRRSALQDHTKGYVWTKGKRK